MPFDRTGDRESRERAKQARREENARRRAALEADPRFQAMKKARQDQRHSANAGLRAATPGIMTQP
jgi:hypothetical protein